MHCPYPKKVGDSLRSCGGCYACRINDRRVWTGRLLLESFFYPESSFVTLTYEDASVPRNDDGQQVLVKKDYKRFIRQFSRSSFGPNFRWYGVGEYGDDSQRPHYHFILFGVGIGWHQEVERSWSKPIKAKNITEKMVRERRIIREGNRHFQLQGFVSMSPLVPERCAYVCGYVVKKMTAEDDTRLKGRPPEFRSMSKQYGGIGCSGLGWLADMQMTNAGCQALAQRKDVFDAIKVEGKVWPIGEYLRDQLRDLAGVPKEYRERLALLGKPDDVESLNPAPFDMASIKSLPLNRRLIDAEKVKVTPQALARIEAVSRKAKKFRGSKV